MCTPPDSALLRGTKRSGAAIASRPDAAASARARLSGPLGEAIPYQWTDDVTDTARALVQSLESSTVSTAVGSVETGRIQSALNWFDAFLDATRVVPFIPIAPGDELNCYAYNQRTLDNFERFIKQRSEAQRGEPIKSDTRSGYVSAIKMLRSREARMNITSSAANVCLKEVLRSGRRDDGPPGDRKKCLGIGGEDFDRVAQSEDLTAPEGCQDFAVGHTGYSALLRGGEVGTTEGGCFDPPRDLTISSIVEREPCPGSRGRPWLTADVCAIKDVNARRKPVPIPICRRATGPRGSDPRCSYDAIMAHVERRRLEVPRAKWSTAPLFVRPDGSHWTTAHVRALARRWALVLGMPPSEVGGKSFRIRGATDIQSTYGAEQGARIVKERGRWSSDVSYIYARASARVQLDASASMADAEGGSLEALIPTWTQPAHR